MITDESITQAYTRWQQANVIAQEACRFPHVAQTERDRLWAIEEQALNEYCDLYNGKIAEDANAQKPIEIPITPEQVQTAIDVLQASSADQLGHIDAALLDQLTDAIDLASYGPILCEVEDAPPVNLG